MCYFSCLSICCSISIILWSIAVFDLSLVGNIWFTFIPFWVKYIFNLSISICYDADQINDDIIVAEIMDKNSACIRIFNQQIDRKRSLFLNNFTHFFFRIEN